MRQRCFESPITHFCIWGPFLRMRNFRAFGKSSTYNTEWVWNVFFITRAEQTYLLEYPPESWRTTYVRRPPVRAHTTIELAHKALFNFSSWIQKSHSNGNLPGRWCYTPVNEESERQHRPLEVLLKKSVHRIRILFVESSSGSIGSSGDKTGLLYSLSPFL